MMSPETGKILDVYRAQAARAGAMIHPADFGDAIVWEDGFVRDEPVRRALEELFEDGYLIEHGAAFELTIKGEDRAYGRSGKPVALNVVQLSGILRSAQAEADLRRYFGVGLRADELPPYTGGRFELLAGGGDQPEVQDEFTPADLLAVEMLSVRVSGPVALDLLEGPLGRKAGKYLRQIPADVPLWSDDAARLICDNGPADLLWRLLEGQDGVGWVTAGKLLARKRSGLVPVYDDIVKCAMGKPANFWTSLRDALRADGGCLLDEIRSLKKASEIPSEVTELRTLDVAVWMHHRRDHTTRRCGGI